MYIHFTIYCNILQTHFFFFIYLVTAPALSSTLKAMPTEQVFCSFSWIAQPVKRWRMSLKMCMWRKTLRQSQKILRSWGRAKTQRKSLPCKRIWTWTFFSSLLDQSLHPKRQGRDAGLDKDKTMTSFWPSPKKKKKSAKAYVQRLDRGSWKNAWTFIY